MKRLLSFAFIAWAAFLTVTAQGVVSNNPMAATNAIVKCGNARFTVLTPEMIRIEYSAKGTFEHQATFTVVNRNLDVPHPYHLAQSPPRTLFGYGACGINERKDLL